MEQSNIACRQSNKSRQSIPGDLDEIIGKYLSLAGDKKILHNQDIQATCEKTVSNLGQFHIQISLK